MGTATRLLATIVASLAVGAGFVACGDDEEEETTPASEASASTEEITLTTADAADGYTWELSATPTAETKSVTYVNESKEPHALIFARLGEGYTLDEAYELQGEKGSAETVVEGDAQPGEERTFQVEKELKPGEYVMICPIPGKPPHYQQGQAEEFEIQ